jgi:hypothetical protein
LPAEAGAKAPRKPAVVADLSKNGSFKEVFVPVVGNLPAGLLPFTLVVLNKIEPAAGTG